MLSASVVVLVPLGVGMLAGSGTSGASVPAAVRLGRAPKLPSGSVPVAALPGSSTLRVDITLQPRNPAALAAYAHAVSTPGSAHYRHYLERGEFAQRFGPGQQAVRQVDQSLAAAGLHPGPVSADGLSIPVRATAQQLSTAFSTGFTQYRVHGGRIAYANTVAPQIAGAAAPFVQTVVGLDDLAVPTPTLQAPTPAAGAGSGTVARPHVATGGPQPCGTAVNDGVADSAYTTDQVASSYGFSSLYGHGDLGAGQTVALYELQGYGVSDIATFQSCYGTTATVSAVPVDGGPAAHSGVGEADVDIEEVVSLAPAAHVLVYQGPNTDAGAYDTYQSIIDQDAAQTVSTSWGLCEPEEGSAAAQAEGTLFEEAAAQGQSVLAAAGDQGSEDCLSTGYSGDSLAVDDPSSQPYVTGVGGTSWSAASSPPAESAWNDGPTCCWGGGGGGISSLWAMPSYQTDNASTGTVNARSSGTPCGAAAGSYCRESPDVSALAGPFPYLNYVSGQWGSWGGTSLAAPLWASLLALTDASTSCAGGTIGFANPSLYQVAASEPTAFNDVTTGNNDLTGDFHGTYPATAGYDMATGLGTPVGATLPGALCGLATRESITITDPGSQSTHLATPVSLHLAATDSTSGQTLTFSSAGLPAGLAIDPSTGVISGTPTTTGSSTVTVHAKDGSGGFGVMSFTWSVTVAVTSASTASAVVGQPFSFTVTVTGVPTSLKSSGKLPKGIKFHNAGNGTATLSGTPKISDATQSYPLTFTATFGTKKSGVVATQAFTITLT